MNKYLLILSLIFLGALSSYAQNSIKGVVLSEDSKGKMQTVPFANVYWMDTNIGTSSNEKGVFQLAVHESERRLVVSFVGYRSDTIYIDDYSKTLNIVLEAAINLDAVEVSSRVTSTEFSFMNPMKMETLNEAELFKAACCNLSESFETNPSVDVSFTDAVTGTRQIRMLGLDGPYTYISRENMPGIRGLANAYGLSFIPGTWINSIQVTKGVGSVVNGYESIAGQINVELQQPIHGEQTFLNLFANESGRMEANFIQTFKLSEKWGSTFLLHGNMRAFEVDGNADGFMDLPMQEQLNLMNRWQYRSGTGLESQIGIHYIKDDKQGGQMSNLKINDASATPQLYTIDVLSERVEAFAKMGYVFPGYKYRNMGIQLSALYHQQNSLYGRNAYDAIERSFYGNYIYQSIIGNTNHQFKTGFSMLFDSYDEKLNQVEYDRTEKVPGAFFEYSFLPVDNFTLISGIRIDHHNIFGTFLTPRLHARWHTDEYTVFRFLAGGGQRTANIFAERQSLLATSRSIELFGNVQKYPYGLKAENAWNFGFNITRDFKLDYREGYVGFDLYRTQFRNQAVLDIEDTYKASFYNLEGESYSNSLQLEVGYELLKYLDLKMAYRYLDVKTDYHSGLKTKPFTPKHRMFVNMAYETMTNLKGGNWMFDATWQWIGEQRIPATVDEPRMYSRASTSPEFFMINAQVSRNFNKRLAVYVGVENLNDYKQLNPIISPENPFGNNFDSGMIWGPVYGRMFYTGLRYRIQKE